MMMNLLNELLTDCMYTCYKINDIKYRESEDVTHVKLSILV